ncbi:hypothetical protein GQ53DRAFT_409523 [Thozetella sp. PMI_491]|nr:hypothetical protein GQ53DRAFT_409523 [Thozetella sp. PMI_491]
MSSRDMQYLYKETRLDLEPASASSVVQLRIAPQSTANRLSSALRSSISGKGVGEDESAWQGKHLATASSIFDRKHHGSPRSILWRVLENGTVLSLQAADICKKQKEADANLVLHIRFSSPIRPSCIGFADPEDHDALYVFVIDQGNQLHSLAFRPDVFRKRTAVEGLGDFCKSYSPPGFGFKHPHRLVAVSPNQLIVTMHDGGILRFDKNRSHDANGGNLWKETIYNVAGWGQSLRGLVPFQRNPTIKYDKINMELTAAVSTAVTNMGHEETSFLFTICLDHRMRVWDVQSGQILYTGDILDLGRDPQDVGKWKIEPTQQNLIRILDRGRGQCLVVTFSPIGAGEFKFWQVKANDQGSVHVADMFPHDKLVPPSPSGSSDIWTMADFAVAEHDHGPQLWIIWKANIIHRVQTLQIFPRNDTGPFADGWRSVFADNTVPTAQVSGPCDPADSTEKWLELIFFPGRFSKATIDTAFAMYQKGLGTPKDASAKGTKSIAEAICSVLGSTSTLERNSAGGMDYEQFRSTSETQWRRFYRLLVELEKQRGEALSLVLDVGTGMIWVVCSDCSAAIRQSSNLDRVCHNIQSPDKDDEDVASLVSAGLNFIGNFSDNMLQLSKAALQAELFEDSAKPDDERIQQFFDKAGFWRQITDQDCAEVVDALGPNFRIVTARLYEDLLDLFSTPGEPNGHELEHPFTHFGRKIALRAVQETAELHWQILFSQLLLLVHMELEIENEDEALHSRLDLGRVYRQLVAALRRLELIKWLVKTQISVPAPKADRIGSGSFSPSLSKRPSDEGHTITAFEGIVGHLLGPTDPEHLLLAITEVAVDVCAPESPTELVPYLQQCWLLKQDRPDLALELGPFSGQDPFSTYIQGRVFLSLRDYDAATIYFEKASLGLSISVKNLERHSSSLLDDTEWNLLNSGLPNYYSHIVNLFDRQKAHSFVARFARIALQFAHAPGHDGAAVRTELQSRLFSAATAIAHYDVAHSTLLSMSDEVLQHSYLRRLIEKMSETGQNAELVSLPFSGLQNKVDDILLEKCRGVRDVINDTPYHQILYAWRIAHNDYRGGAAILLDRLQKLRAIGEADKLGGDDSLDTQVTRQYLLLINALSCVTSKEAYILEDMPPEEDGEQGGGDKEDDGKLEELARALDEDQTAVSSRDEDKVLKEAMKKFSRAYVEQAEPRRIVTLPDLRKQYQQELDRIVAIQNNQFGFAADDDVVMNFA